MTSQRLKDVGSNLGLFLVFGLLVGMMFHNPAAGALGGLICHLLISALYRLSDDSGLDSEM